MGFKQYPAFSWGHRRNPANMEDCFQLLDGAGLEGGLQARYEEDSARATRRREAGKRETRSCFFLPAPL